MGDISPRPSSLARARGGPKGDKLLMYLAPWPVLGPARCAAKVPLKLGPIYGDCDNIEQSRM